MQHEFSFSFEFFFIRRKSFLNFFKNTYALVEISTIFVASERTLSYWLLRLSIRDVIIHLLCTLKQRLHFILNFKHCFFFHLHFSLRFFGSCCFYLFYSIDLTFFYSRLLILFQLLNIFYQWWCRQRFKCSWIIFFLWLSNWNWLNFFHLKICFRPSSDIFSISSQILFFWL